MLVKALKASQSHYAVGLRNGQVVDFERAELVPGGEWLHLSEIMETKSVSTTGISYPFPHGLDVRISDIVWAAYTPDGE